MSCISDFEIQAKHLRNLNQTVQQKIFAVNRRFFACKEL